MLRSIKLASVWLSLCLGGCATLGIGHNKYYCDEQPTACSNASTWLLQNSSQGSNLSPQALALQQAAQQQAGSQGVAKQNTAGSSNTANQQTRGQTANSGLSLSLPLGQAVSSQPMARALVSPLAVTQVAEVKPNLVIIKEQTSTTALDSRYLKVWLAPVVIQGEALTSKVLIVPFVH